MSETYQGTAGRERASQIRIATIGAFGHLGRVLGELDATPDLRVAAMAKSPAGEDPRAYQQAHASARDAAMFEDHRRMLDEVRPDVVVISTRLDLVAPLAIECAQRGVHLICEKPLALQQDALRELWDACLAQRVQCIALLSNHVHPVMLAARRAADEGRIGRVALLNARKSYKWGNRPAWFGSRPTYGGTIPWIGIHALDFIYSITGEPFTSVAATHANVAHPEYVECEDVAALTLTLRDGARATASLDLLRPPAADTHGDDRLRIVGAHGVIEANLTRNTCTLTTDDQPAHPLDLPPAAQAFVPFLRTCAAGAASAATSPDMRRGFVLTHASLCARYAADSARVVAIDSPYHA